MRKKAGRKVLVVLNLSGTAQRIALADKTFLDSYYNVFKGGAEKLTATPWQLAPWGCAVYGYGK